MLWEQCNVYQRLQSRWSFCQYAAVNLQMQWSLDVLLVLELVGSEESRDHDVGLGTSHAEALFRRSRVPRFLFSHLIDTARQSEAQTS